MHRTAVRVISRPYAAESLVHLVLPGPFRTLAAGPGPGAPEGSGQALAVERAAGVSAASLHAARASLTAPLRGNTQARGRPGS